MRREKPATALVRLLNDLADRRAIMLLLGATEAQIGVDLMAYAERRIAPARPTSAAAPRDKRWVDGLWVDNTSDDVYS